jgi:uncharacterized protein (DUF433 family)
MSEKPIREDDVILPGGDGHVVAAPGVCGGRPRIRGTRITVADLLAALAAGDTMEGLVEDLDDLSREDILAALKFAASHVNHAILAAA